MGEIGRLVILSLSKLLGLKVDAFWCGIRHIVKLAIVRRYKGICAGRFDKVFVATKSSTESKLPE